MSRMERAGRTDVRKPTRLDQALGELVQDLGLSKKLREYDVLTSWHRIVGEQIARVTTAQRVNKGILYVGVSSAPWRTELTMKRRALIERINEALGQPVIKDIRFR